MITDLTTTEIMTTTVESTTAEITFDAETSTTTTPSNILMLDNVVYIEYCTVLRIVNILQRNLIEYTISCKVWLYCVIWEK